MQIRDFLLPITCLECGKFVDSEGLCPSCWKKITWISKPKCEICGSPFELNLYDTCLSCIKNRPSFDKAISVFEYNAFSKNIILRFKHFDATYAACKISAWMYRAGQLEIDSADIIVPVPIRFSKRIIRMYNQTELLAVGIHKLSGEKALYEPRILVKSKHTKTQEGLTGRKRRKNIVGSFSVSEAYKDLLTNKNVVLIDDVFTTGTTVNECAKVLKKSGAKSVVVVTAAMVVMH